MAVTPAVDGGATAKPFRNRVRVLVEVVDDRDELALATAAFGAQGWLVRPPRDGEIGGYPARNRTWLLLEVRFPGYPRQSVKVAVKRADEIIERFRLGAWVRRAEDIRFPREREVTYFVDETPPRWLARLRALAPALAPALRFAGLPRTAGLIRLTGAQPEPAVRARLAQLDLGRPFDPARFSLRPATAATTADGIPAPSEQAPMSFLLLAVAGLIVAAVCGALAEWADGGWKAIPLLWLGGSYDAEYLGDFGIPSGAVSVPTFFRLAITAKSALIGLAFVLLFVAAIGWARYFHWFDESIRWYPLLLVTLLSAVYLLASITIGLGDVNGAASDAADAARAGRNPASYFGMRGTLECVRPVTAAVPVYDGPLPAGRPLLSFGATGSQLWVWDPSTRRSIGIPLDDVTVIPATGSPARCPSPPRR